MQRHVVDGKVIGPGDTLFLTHPSGFTETVTIKRLFGDESFAYGDGAGVERANVARALAWTMPTAPLQRILGRKNHDPSRNE